MGKNEGSNQIVLNFLYQKLQHYKLYYINKIYFANITHFIW